MIKKLEMLIALAKEQHFGRAAQSLGVTQPSLSTGIRQLEEQLGVRLVQRGARFGGLTPEGQRALTLARQIVGDTRRLRDEMRATHAGLAGHLRIAVIPTALTWAARLTSQFTALHPNVSFTILSRSSIDILKMLETLEIDAGITYLDNEPLGRVSANPLYQEHYTLLCPRSHPLAGRDEVEWGELADSPLCLLTPDMQNRRIINRNFMEAGVAPRALIESNSMIVLVTNVMEGGLATILPTDLARFLVAGRDLSMVPLRTIGRAPSVGLIALHQEPFTPVLQALMKTSRDIAAA
ncbi:MAG: LysR family transcriptional regulator [Paracoccaceae bacterium]